MTTIVLLYVILQTHWSTDSECLTVNRNTPGYSTNGNMSLCAYSSDKNVSEYCHYVEEIARRGCYCNYIVVAYSLKNALRHAV